jgi:hypothetical protein
MKNIVISTNSEQLTDAVVASRIEGVEVHQLLLKAWDPTTTERIFYIGVGLTSSVATNLFSSWLWEIIKEHRTDKTKIEGGSCPNSEARVAAMIEKIVEESEQQEAKGKK